MATPAKNHRRWLALIASLPLIVGCITPSIPIPPPNENNLGFDMNAVDGTATFSYPPSSNFGFATVYVYNRDQGRGVIDTARLDGSVGPTAPFPAVSGDQIVVTFEVDGESSSACAVLDAGGRNPDASCAM